MQAAQTYPPLKPLALACLQACFRFLVRPQLLTRVSSPPAWRGIPLFPCINRAGCLFRLTEEGYPWKHGMQLNELVCV